MTAIMNVRASVRDSFEAQHGTSLSPLPFIARAVTLAIPRHPVVNSSMDLDAGTVTYLRGIHLGIALDTDCGLLVSSIKNAETLTVAGMARAITNKAKRAREKNIKPGDVSGATSAITNIGSRGTLFDTPILNALGVAILAICAVEECPVIVSGAHGDAVAIRWMTYPCPTYDHWMIDGADDARFLQDLKWTVEHHDFRSDLM